MSTKKGTLITFEGVDFSGKSVQAQLLKEELESHNLPVTLLREPGGTTISEKIRDLLLDSSHDAMSPGTEVLLYSAARAQMVRELIVPKLENGEIVICDRYFDSTTVYQGYGREINLDFIKKLNKFVVLGILPDLTFLLDLEPEEVARRHPSRDLDRMEREESGFHERVRAGYLKLAREEKNRFVVINGARPVDRIQKEIIATVKKKLHLF